jgi:hypothetical protein
MELTVDVKYRQIVDLVRQLPENKIAQLRDFLTYKSIALPKTTTKNEDLQTLVLRGPTMSDEQYETFLQNRKMFKLI